MGLLEGVAGTTLSAVGLGGIVTRLAQTPSGFSNDFPEGLTIIEYRNGKPLDKDKVRLVGSFMPMIPFEFGGKQQIVKDYYPGNPEPVVQILGPRENEVTIRGKLKTKRFKTSGENAFTNAVQAAQEYQELIDAMRLRGNLVQITLGEWRRYGLIEECIFKLNRLTEIEYQITFAIIGFNYPTNCKIIDTPDDNLIAPNKEITSAAADALAKARNYPATMPRSIADFLTDQISNVASAVNLVTDFVDGALKDVENIGKAANRAVGLIKNARATISRTARRVGALQLTVANLSSGITADSFRTAAQFNNAAHIKNMLNSFSSLALLLAQLQKRFAAIAQQIPIRRHLVKQGETLQKIAITYYNNADLWKNIYDHNKLQTPVLVVGTVLEIPRA
jgi:hypothetical protein